MNKETLKKYLLIFILVIACYILAYLSCIWAIKDAQNLSNQFAPVALVLSSFMLVWVKILPILLIGGCIIKYLNKNKTNRVVLLIVSSCITAIGIFFLFG